MTEVKRSTEHSLERGNIYIKINAPDNDTIYIYTKESYSNSMQVKVADIETLRIALEQFMGWINNQPKSQEAE